MGRWLIGPGGCMSGTVGSPPVIVVRDVSVAPGQRIGAASMIVSANDVSGSPITQYGFWDGGSGDGHFTVNDVTQPSGNWIFIAADQLATIAYIGGVGFGAESLFVQAFSEISASLFLSRSSSNPVVGPVIIDVWANSGTFPQLAALTVIVTGIQTAVVLVALAIRRRQYRYRES